MSLWWWYVAALLFIGAIVSVGGEIARAIAGGPVPPDDPPDGKALATEPVGGPRAVFVMPHHQCRRCGWVEPVAPADKAAS